MFSQTSTVPFVWKSFCKPSTYCWLCLQPHLVLGLISQIIKVSSFNFVQCSLKLYYVSFFLNIWKLFTIAAKKQLLLRFLQKLFLDNDVNLCFWKCCHQIQLLADVNLKKTPQLVELIGDSKVHDVSCCYSYFILKISRGL